MSIELLLVDATWNHAQAYQDFDKPPNASSKSFVLSLTHTVRHAAPSVAGLFCLIVTAYDKAWRAERLKIGISKDILSIGSD